MFKADPIYRKTLHHSLALVLAASLLAHCAQEQVSAPTVGQAKSSGKSQSAQTESDAADAATRDSAAGATPAVDIDKLTTDMAALQAQKTDITKRMSLVTVASADTGISNLQADQENSTHNAAADGIGVAAGVAGTAASVAFAVATGGVGGLILGGIGLVGGAIGTVSSGVALANDASAQQKHDATIKTNAVTLDQADTLKKNYQAQLDAVNAEISKVQDQIDAYNAAQLKAITGSSTVKKTS